MQRRLIITATALAIVVTAGPASAYEPVTYGDVRAQFEAVETGGGVIISKRGLETTIPPAGALAHSIRPIRPFFDGRHYCDLDWHLVAIALFFAPEDVSLSTTEEIRDFLMATEVTFRIDNVPTPAEETTAVTTVLSPQFGVPGDTFGRAWGIFFAPGALAIGTHSLTGSATFPNGVSVRFDRIRFTIDPVGADTCL